MLPFYAPLIAPIFRRNALYYGEMDAWAKALGISKRRMLLLQHLYELTHLKLSGIAANVIGCTAGVKWFDDLGMVHVRTLDWPLESIGQATRLFRFRRGQREFVTVGIAGFVGVLSGMVPGAYSVTINWAPAAGRPRLKNIGPAYLLRKTLDECDGYEAAVEMLSRTPLSTSVIYTVCGAERGQAGVIERTQNECSVARIGADGVVSATNHFISPQLAAGNLGRDHEYISRSTERRNEMSRSLRELSKAGSAEQLGAILAGVENEFTCHKIVFVPATGEARVWPVFIHA